MSAPAHIPVMLQEVLQALAPKDGGIYLDGTFGAGGYAQEILDSADCRLIALDRDPDAVAAGSALVARYGARLALSQGRFSDMERAAAAAGAQQVDGVALDRMGPSAPLIFHPTDSAHPAHTRSHHARS